MEATTELATAHSIILRLVPPLLASLALSTCSASIGRFRFQRFAFSAAPCFFSTACARRCARVPRRTLLGTGYEIIIIYTPTKSTLIHTTSTTADVLVSVQHLRRHRLRSRKATCRFMHALFTFRAFLPVCSCDLSHNLRRGLDHARGRPLWNRVDHLVVSAINLTALNRCQRKYIRLAVARRRRQDDASRRDLGQVPDNEDRLLLALDQSPPGDLLVLHSHVLAHGPQEEVLERERLLALLLLLHAGRDRLLALGVRRKLRQGRRHAASRRRARRFGCREVSARRRFGRVVDDQSPQINDRAGNLDAWAYLLYGYLRSHTTQVTPSFCVSLTQRCDVPEYFTPAQIPHDAPFMHFPPPNYVPPMHDVPERVFWPAVGCSAP